MKYIPKKQASIVNDFYADSTYIIYTPTYANLPFQPTGAGFFFAGNRYFVERDNLKMHLVMMTVKGSGTITYRNKTIMLLPGQAVLLNGTEYHMYRTSPEMGKWDFKWVRFHSRYFPQYDKLINNDSLYPILVLNTEFEQCIDLFIQYIKSKEAMKDIPLSNLISTLLTVLCDQVSFAPYSQFREKKYNGIEDIRKYIDANFDKNIHINDLSRRCNINKFAFI